ncbi:hypothetical protein ACFPOI_14900 [Nonomuraea angiospora]|uniref:Uncharacterized protein n=1 Tax=Nonomuraea angiospora TaxID=46172 RepID=A0ABR9MG19_9ACTN|nr:hypothetical protein [Nonomuraea angiospora]MBE1591833.1 hypothetical protein [Nonomuraea angiospora]
MNIEAQILTLITRIRALEESMQPGDDSSKTISIAQVLAELTDIRAEMRQDLAALGDELAGLRRHMNDRFATIQSELLHRLGGLPPEVIN